MTDYSFNVAHLTDEQLLTEIKQLAQRERKATAQLIASLVELDSRKLYLGEGCSSLFTYCTRILRLSENAAYGRIAAARAARRFPIILQLLQDGSVNLTAVGLLAPHLAQDNYRKILEAAQGRSKREVEAQVAALHPRPDIPSSVRKLQPPRLPEPTPTESTDLTGNSQLPCASKLSPPVRQALVAPLSPERYQIKFTVGRDTHDKLRRAQDLLRHTIPNGDPAAIFDRALTLLLADLAKNKCGATGRPRKAGKTKSRSRHIPRSVRRAVWARDGGQCAFVGVNGRCSETGLLEYHHVVPFAVGGQADIDTIELRCAAHNRYEAEQYFGLSQPWLVREEAMIWPAYARGGDDQRRTCGSASNGYGVMRPAVVFAAPYRRL